MVLDRTTHEERERVVNIRHFAAISIALLLLFEVALILLLLLV